MKNFITLINLCLIFVITTIFTPSRNSSENQDGFGNNEQASSKTWTASTPVIKSFTAAASQSEHKIYLNKWDETFLIATAENILNNIGVAKMAEQRGTTRDVKSYGTTLVKDQSEILAELRKLATLKAISFPADAEYSDAKDALKDIHGESFDRKFMKMILFDQKRYAKDFERAVQSNDPDIQVFATKYLPVIRSHLVQIKSMKKTF